MIEGFAAFKKNYLVHGLTDVQLLDVYVMAQHRRFAANETMIRQGDPGGELYVILEGKVNVLTQDGQKLAEVGPGDVLGEIELIDARPRSANAVAYGLVDVAAFDSKGLRNYMSSHRDVGFVMLANLGRVLCMRLRSADSRIDTLLDQTSDVWHNVL